MTIDPIGASALAPAATTPAKPGFADAFKRALDSVNQSQNHADQLAREFQMENPEVSLEETIIAAQKANLSFQAIVQVRNKVIAAYQEIMNMQV